MNKMGKVILNLMLAGNLLAGSAMAAEAHPASFAAMTREQVDEFLSGLAASDKNHAKRLIDVSERFLGVPFAASPLGEGPGNLPDPDPLLRLDAVDCTTLIEQTIALSQSVNLEEANALLLRVRYLGGEIGYTTRKHFMMAQWIPVNQEEGFVEDITRQVGGETVRLATKRLDATVWKKRRKKDKWPRLSPGQVPEGTFSLPIIPLDKVEGLLEKIPEGTILNVVRKDYRTMPVRVTHQGLVVVKKGKRYLRHAARAGYRRVVDERLQTFIRRNRAYTKWPVEGFNLLRTKPSGGVQK